MKRTKRVIRVLALVLLWLIFAHLCWIFTAAAEDLDREQRQAAMMNLGAPEDGP